jgi:hypothetical protein
LPNNPPEPVPALKELNKPPPVLGVVDPKSPVDVADEPELDPLNKPPELDPEVELENSPEPPELPNKLEPPPPKREEPVELKLKKPPPVAAGGGKLSVTEELAAEFAGSTVFAEGGVETVLTDGFSAGLDGG